MLLTAALLAAGLVAAGVLPVRPAATARADEGTISANNLRNGWDPAETTGSLTPSALTGGSFGQIFSANVDGQVYAQPVVAGGTLIVATENDWVYGLNARTGAVQWSTSLGTPWPSAAGHCTDLQPSVGVTGTPVYDPATGTVYLVSEDVPAGNSDQQPEFELNALDASTGQQRQGWPVPVAGAPVNDPTVPFNAFTQLQRPGLLLSGGSVYMAFGSHCDFVPYEGYVAGVNTTSRALTMWSDESGTTDTQAGIWQSGGGLMSDGPGRIFFSSGNGISPPPGPGSKPPPELAEAVVRLAVQNDGSLAAKDFFSPANAPYLDAVDGDYGSGAPVGLPFGSAALPHLLLQAGKLDGLYVLNRDGLGGRDQGPGHTDAAVSRAGQSLPGLWGHPGAFATTPVLTKANVAASRDYVYYLGQNDALRYFRAGLGGADGVTPVLADVAQSTDKFGYTSGSPVVTSNGTATGSAVVWVVNSSDEYGTTGRLQAFPAVPPASCSQAKPCSIAPLWSSLPFSGAGKFTTAATDGGRVYIGTRGVVSAGSNCPAVPDGDYCAQVLAFGSPSTAPLGGAGPVRFGYVPVGSSSSARTVTVTNTQASQDVTVTAAATTGPGFAVAGPYQYTPSGSSTAVPTSLPRLLHPGDALTAGGVTFSPAGPGGATGSLQFSTDSDNFPVVGVPLSGVGTQNGFYAASSSVAFGSVPGRDVGAAAAHGHQRRVGPADADRVRARSAIHRVRTASLRPADPARPVRPAHPHLRAGRGSGRHRIADPYWRRRHQLHAHRDLADRNRRRRRGADADRHRVRLAGLRLGAGRPAGGQDDHDREQREPARGDQRLDRAAAAVRNARSGRGRPAGHAGQPVRRPRAGHLHPCQPGHGDLGLPGDLDRRGRDAHAIGAADRYRGSPGLGHRGAAARRRLAV